MIIQPTGSLAEQKTMRVCVYEYAYEYEYKHLGAEELRNVKDKIKFCSTWFLTL